MKSHLDYREKGGYSIEETIFTSQEKDATFKLNLYLANEENDEYLGPAEMEEIASQVYNSVGPSGRNIDYVLNLAKAVRETMPHVNDQHLFDLEQRLLTLDKSKGL